MIQIIRVVHDQEGAHGFLTTVKKSQSLKIRRGKGPKHLIDIVKAKTNYNRFHRNTRFTDASLCL